MTSEQDIIEKVSGSDIGINMVSTLRENMPAITLKNIPGDLYDQIKKSAHSNYRSINSEVLFLLKQSIEHKQIDLLPDEFFSEEEAGEFWDTPSALKCRQRLRRRQRKKENP
ncbi:Arc family DNA-binding protein [candidate division KSB1 bacterium]|nr:Arc family DNA-binding protein [candidate division KSB1 bacterium]MBL7093149.1 Arc family DNA-binding protein [candidate division KSB1 bacterium]